MADETGCEIRLMKCAKCGSGRIYRSQRRGLCEGILFRLIGRAPYRCRDCGVRYIASNRHFRRRESNRNERSLAEYIGLRGREHKVRRWAIAFIVTAFLLVVSIAFLLNMLQS
jgi:hypothetical protein